MWVLIYSLVVCAPGCVRGASFDQSQSGGLNVQVDLKDLHIFTLLKGGKEEYVDYDYAYDYSEMTIKPQNGTTPKPLNSTSTTGATSGANGTSPEDQAAVTTAITLDNTTDARNSSTNLEMETTTLATLFGPANASEVAASPIISISSMNSALTNSTSGGCKKGFALSQKGDCELKLQGTGSTNALLKLVKLSQKLKLRRERRNSTISEG